MRNLLMLFTSNALLLMAHDPTLQSCLLSTGIWCQAAGSMVWPAVYIASLVQLDTDPLKRITMQDAALQIHAIQPMKIRGVVFFPCSSVCI
jgi:hypothetical protein